MGTGGAGSAGGERGCLVRGSIDGYLLIVAVAVVDGIMIRCE